ncbi:MAG: hypothetical protein K6G26_11125, partial [Lachnospiraceae bacterium]|nr:hypothetical protein [Lachnospiraceae bacterium]
MKKKYIAIMIIVALTLVIGIFVARSVFIEDKKNFETVDGCIDDKIQTLFGIARFRNICKNNDVELDKETDTGIKKSAEKIVDAYKEEEIKNLCIISKVIYICDSFGLEQKDTYVDMLDDFYIEEDKAFYNNNLECFEREFRELTEEDIEYCEMAATLGEYS